MSERQFRTVKRALVLSFFLLVGSGSFAAQTPPILDCVDRLSAEAYRDAPVSRGRLDAALEISGDPEYLRQLVETLRWANTVSPNSFTKVAKALRNPHLSHEYIAATLAPVFEVVPRDTHQAVLEFYLSQFPRVPSLPREERNLAAHFAAIAQNTAAELITNQFSSLEAQLIALATGRGHSFNRQDIDGILPSIDDLQREASTNRTKAEYQFLLLEYQQKYFQLSLGNWLLCAKQPDCDPLEVLESTFPAFARKHLLSHPLKTSLLQKTLYSSVLGNTPLKGPEIHKGFIAWLVREIVDLVEEGESRTTPSEEKEAPQNPVIFRYQHKSHPPSARLPRSSDENVVSKPDPAPLVGTSNYRGSLPELTPDRRQALKEAPDLLSSMGNVSFETADHLLTRLLGARRTRGSHYIFHCPFGRGLVIIVHHGKNIDRVKVAELRRLVRDLREAYGLQ